MGKRIENARKLLNAGELYSLDNAISFFVNDYAQKFKAKYDETIELVLQLGVDAKQSDQMVRGAVAMPHGLGKQKIVAAIVDEKRVQEAKDAGAEHVGGEDLIEKIKSGFLDFDVCVATPAMMPKLAAIAKLLGPKGLMPNPKLGTVSDNVSEAITSVKKGQVEFRVEKNGIIHAGVAKIGFAENKIKENLMALYGAVLAAKPAKSKGVYVRGSFLSSSQGPSLKLDLKSFVI
ncbi:50S ribosomal protein L1 [Candidatus Bandiella euplotis]|uniref:Large ribosomal subunit protein uL1 n=1 Tax=Candidatus Bandiella euplotis TaxID=1664265 RepID=A0ABZ0UK15_9RICK|nr:50S ribosomal protein L1 [Candidatus Bandiella woodruffii]WPX96007.1 50S ribosomal protein L1 [Candidatus Bandiella woodruffii]